jgi:hypothetical protein
MPEQLGELQHSPVAQTTRMVAILIYIDYIIQQCSEQQVPDFYIFAITHRLW